LDETKDGETIALFVEAVFEREDVEGAVDDYLALCEQEGIEPENRFKESFNVLRVVSKIHRQASITCPRKETES